VTDLTGEIAVPFELRDSTGRSTGSRRTAEMAFAGVPPPPRLTPLPRAHHAVA